MNYSRAQLFKSYGSVVFQRSLSRMFSQFFSYFSVLLMLPARERELKISRFALEFLINDKSLLFMFNIT